MLRTASSVASIEEMLTMMGQEAPTAAALVQSKLAAEPAAAAAQAPSQAPPQRSRRRSGRKGRKASRC